jgi:hypothetical protein
MEKINKFNEEIDELEKIDNLQIKSENVKKIKEEIKNEQEKVDIMIDKISNIKPKKHKSYKGISLEELSIKFQDEKDLKEKLKIYEHICYLIELTKNQLFEET